MTAGSAPRAAARIKQVDTTEGLAQSPSFLPCDECLRGCGLESGTWRDSPPRPLLCPLLGEVCSPSAEQFPGLYGGDRDGVAGRLRPDGVWEALGQGLVQRRLGAGWLQSLPPLTGYRWAPTPLLRVSHRLRSVLLPGPAPVLYEEAALRSGVGPFSTWAWGPGGLGANLQPALSSDISHPGRCPAEEVPSPWPPGQAQA